MAASQPRHIGLILAAGKSRRMGQPKQLLEWPSADGPSTVIAAAFDSIAAFCSHMIITIGNAADQVRAALASRELEEVACDSNAPMIESLRQGLLRARRIDSSAAVLLMPGDNPGVLPSTIRRVCHAAATHPGCAIMPECGGKGGHPALIPPELFDHILSGSCDQGLRAFWADHPELRVRIPVDDPACGRDLDTPEDYAIALRELKAPRAPGP